MATSRSPVYIGFDSTNTPSGLNIYQDDDFISEANGGTGVTSFSELNLHCSTLGATSSVSATYVSATHITTSAVNSMPYPPPFGYAQLDDDGTSTVDEKNLGDGATITAITSDTYGSSGANDITWDNTHKYFSVSAAGTYEILGVMVFEGGSTLVNLSVQKNGSDVLVSQPRVHSTVDPLEHSMRWVGAGAAGDYFAITYDATASNAVKPIAGSTISIKRLK